MLYYFKSDSGINLITLTLIRFWFKKTAFEKCIRPVLHKRFRETTDSEVIHALEPIFHRCKNKTAYFLILKYINYEQMYWYQKVTRKIAIWRSNPEYGINVIFMHFECAFLNSIIIFVVLNLQVNEVMYKNVRNDTKIFISC